MTIEEAINRIPYKRGFFRIWAIFSLLWIGWFTVPALLPERPASPVGPIDINTIRLDDDERTPEQRHWDAQVEFLSKAGLIVGVPLAIPVAVVVAYLLGGWIREGFEK